MAYVDLRAFSPRGAFLTQTDQIAYIIFEAPSNLLLKRMSPHLWQSRIFLTWGIITACHAAVQNYHQLFAVRFLLG